MHLMMMRLCLPRVDELLREYSTSTLLLGIGQPVDCKKCLPLIHRRCGRFETELSAPLPLWMISGNTLLLTHAYHCSLCLSQGSAPSVAHLTQAGYGSGAAHISMVCKRVYSEGILRISQLPILDSLKTLICFIVIGCSPLVHRMPAMGTVGIPNGPFKVGLRA